MTEHQTFADWVRPIASVLWTDRQRVIEFARSLAHLAGGNDQLVQIILRAVTSREPLAASAMQPDTDAENAARVEERRSWTIDALIAELERDGDEVQELLSRLTDRHKDLQLDGLRLTLGQFLSIVHHERHDMEHLQQMKP